MQGGKNNATKTFKFMLDLCYPSVPLPVGTQHPKSTTNLTSFIFSFPSSLLYLKTHKLSKIFSQMPWMSYNIYIHTFYVPNIPSPIPIFPSKTKKTHPKMKSSSSSPSPSRKSRDFVSVQRMPLQHQNAQDTAVVPKRLMHHCKNLRRSPGKQVASSKPTKGGNKCQEQFPRKSPGFCFFLIYLKGELIHLFWVFFCLRWCLVCTARNPGW